MKVICIDDKGDNLTHPDSHSDLVEGRVYTVTGESYGESSNGFIQGYELLEGSPDKVYRKSRFIPLSQIDETTFERNYNTQTV